MPETEPGVPAATAEPSGIGGWLILPMLGLIATPVRIAIDFFQTFGPVFTADGWAYVSAPDRHDWFMPFIVAECAINVVLFIFTLALLYLFFKKSHRVPELFITWLVVLFLVQIADLAGVAGLLGSSPDATDIRELGRSLVSAIIWIPYFMVSKRVKNTFVHQRRSPDRPNAKLPLTWPVLQAFG